MKINFVSFLNPFRFHGGGELDNRMLLNEGLKQGLDIKFFHRVNNKYLNRFFCPPRSTLHKNPDLWILSDLFNVPEYKLKYPKNFVEDIVYGQKYIHLDNAYVDICSKGPLPCGGSKQNCLKGCSNKLSYDLYKNSLLNVFLSPLHADTINSYFDNEFLGKTFIARPLVEPKHFFNQNRERDIDFIYVGTVSNYKGYQNVKKRFSGEKNFLFIGKNATGEKLFGKHIEHIPNSELTDYLNRAKNFVHLPLWKEPMGRTVVEAALCGCNIISNTNTGASSFDFDLSNASEIEGAAVRFWEQMNLICTSKANYDQHYYTG